LRLLLTLSPWISVLGVIAFVADALLGTQLSVALHQVHAQASQRGSCLGGRLAACPNAPAG
jgi:membrane protein required for beta-lactamase induction